MSNAERMGHREIFYPNDWPAIARAVKEANNYVCQGCQRQCRRPGELWLGWEYELTVAHYDHIYDGEAAFVVALCIGCHFRHDSKHSWKARHRHARLRRALAGQAEINYA